MIAMSHRALHPYAVCIALAALSSAAWAQAPLHLETDAGWSHGAVSNAALDARLAAAALQYRSYAPVPRIAFFDLAYPKDSTEAAAMHGYAVLVVTAVVQDSTELPLPHVYVRAAARLRPVRQWGSRAAARRPCGFVAACVRYHRASHVREVSS